MVGLTGPWENVRAACKVYRVYFSTPPNISPNEDYVSILERYIKPTKPYTARRS